MLPFKSTQRDTISTDKNEENFDQSSKYFKALMQNGFV